MVFGATVVPDGVDCASARPVPRRLAMIAKIKQFDRRDVGILHRFARRLWTVFAGYVKRVMEFNRDVRHGRPLTVYTFNSIRIPS